MQFDEYTPQERSSFGRKGGIASGLARRRRREEIEREKVHDIALREMSMENAKMIRRATRILLDAKRNMESTGL